jgi:hypothetical protein
MKSYMIHCLSEAIGPITHMSGTAGNEGIVAREPVHTERGVMMVPYLSGNALRHRCVREPMALWLIDRYELRGKLSLLQLNFLLHGGNLTMSNAHENTRRIADMHEYWPMLSLCGGSLPDQILTGKLDCWRGTLVCQENRVSISRVMPELPGDRLLSCERFLSGYQYTRGDAKKTGLAKDRDDLDETNLMIYSGQAVTRGAMFHHGFVAKHVSEIELGCLLLSLRLWQANGGTIGGNARLGHGRLELSLVGIKDDGMAVDAYVAHVDSVREKAIQWLDDAFAKSSAAKAAKGGKTSQKGLLSDDDAT